MRIFLLRHLPTISNEDGFFMGQSDVPIKRPASSFEFPNMGGRLEVFSSTLRRCVQTVEIFVADYFRKNYSSQPIGIHLAEGFKERGLGQFEGRKKTEVYHEYADKFLHGTMLPWFIPPGGESFTSFSSRVEETYRYVLARGRQVNVLVCCHLQVLRMITCLHRSLEIETNWSTIRYPHGQIVSLD